MPDETPMPFWKKLVPKPSGALPGGLISQVGVGIICMLIASMLISQQFCGAGEPAPTAAGGPEQEPVAGAVNYDRQLEGMTRQTRRERDQEELRAARKQKLDEQAVLAAGLGGGRVARDESLFGRRGASGSPTSRPGGMSQGQTPPGETYQTDAEFELIERLRLESIERTRRSLRVGPVVLSHRTGSVTRAVQESEPTGPGAQGPPAQDAGPPASAGVSDALAAFQSTLAALTAAETPQPAATGGDTPQPPVAPLPADREGYDEPARSSAPFNPPGFDRIYEGSFLEGALVTQLSGEFTGPVLAMVALPFYSADRQRVLVPRGTRAIGTAQAIGGPDQERLAVGFHRLVFPDGNWVELKFDGLNQAGDAALKDKVNRHYLSMFAAVGAVGVLSGLTLRGSSPYSGGQAGFQAGAGQGFGQAGMQILTRFLNRYPTITIRAGHRLRIWFTSDVLVPRPPPQGETK